MVLDQGELDRVAEALREQREDGKSADQGAIAVSLGISQSTVSLYEREPGRLARRGPTFARRFFEEYKLPGNRISEFVKIVFAEYAKAMDSGDATPQKRIPGGLVVVQVLGVANGGKPGAYELPVDPKFVRGNNTRAFQVVGDSMDDGSDDAIRDGEYVLADISLVEPVPNRVFLLQIIGDGMTVKRLKLQAGIWMFVADNKASDESWRADEVEIIGQVYAGGGYKYIH